MSSRGKRIAEWSQTEGMSFLAYTSGRRVYIQPGCMVPPQVVGTLTQRYLELEDVEVLHLLTVGPT